MASHALQAALEKNGCEAVVQDVLKSNKKNVSGFVSKLYDNMVLYMPFLFSMLYHAGELVSSSKHHSPIYYLNSIYSQRLYNEITKIKPDAIVCPHIFSAQAITRLREKKNLTIPTLGIMTDYTWTPFWEETNLDAYVVPAEQIINQCVARGMPKEKLYPLGIPVHTRFQKNHSRDDARKAFGITAKKVFVLMGGSMGYGRIRELACMLTDRLPDAQVVAVCGKNERLYQSLANLKNVTPLGYIDNVDLLMDAADVIITKPGGLSATEAMVKRVPVVLAYPIPGGEIKNAKLLSSIGAAAYEKDPKKAADAAVALISDPYRCAKMVEAQNKYINRHADSDIAKLIISLINRQGGKQPCCRVL